LGFTHHPGLICDTLSLVVVGKEEGLQQLDCFGTNVDSLEVKKEQTHTQKMVKALAKCVPFNN